MAREGGGEESRDSRILPQHTHPATILPSAKTELSALLPFHQTHKKLSTLLTTELKAWSKSSTAKEMSG